MPAQPTRPATRFDFEIAVICALTLEAEAVEALFDHCWDDDDDPYEQVPGDPNAYSTGRIGRHNVVLVCMPEAGKANAAAVASGCRVSFPNIRLAILAGICGAVPFDKNEDEIILGDVIVSDGVIQYDLGRQLPGGYARKDTLQDSLGRPNKEIRTLLAKLKSMRQKKSLQAKLISYLEVLQREPELEAHYPGASHDKLFEASYTHVGPGTCEDCGCNGRLIPRKRLEGINPKPTIHIGTMASGDTVMRSGDHRDALANREKVIGFEMESAGIWDCFPCVVIKGVCDYADSHKSKLWQRHAAATAAACTKAFLTHWKSQAPVSQT